MKTLLPDPALPPIVIVDDSEDDIFLLRHRLRQGGITHPVVAFNSAPAALAYLSDWSSANLRPALFFTDIRMPEGCGLELIAWIRSDPEWDEMRVVVVTSSNHPDDLARALALRVDGYLIKFPPPDLLAEFVAHGPWFAIPGRESVHIGELAHA
jgi:CheY-like chemotaxis protein